VDDLALHVHWYVDQWTLAFLSSPGSRNNLAFVPVTQVRRALTLVGWSWTAGYALGTLARRTAWAPAVLFALVVVCGTLGATTIARVNDAHDGLFASHLAGVFLPRLIRLTCVLLPVVAGLRYSRHPWPHARRWAICGVAGLALLTLWAAGGLEASITFGRGEVTATAGAGQRHRHGRIRTNRRACSERWYRTPRSIAEVFLVSYVKPFDMFVEGNETGNWLGLWDDFRNFLVTAA
jgi:hypothetical protein